MSVNKRVIYQLVDSRGPGGIESHIYNLSDWLVQRGYDNRVIFMNNYGSHPLKTDLSQAGIPWLCLKSLAQLHQLLKQTECLLCTHGYKAGIVGRLLARFHKTPVVSTHHSGDQGSGKLRFYSFLDEFSSFIANETICVSEEIAKRLTTRSTLINNFVSRQPLKANRGKAVAFVGRLSSEKGPDRFAQITQSIGMPCHVYGDGPMKQDLEREFPHLLFMGHVDMSTHWEKIGVLCITSRSEGLPLVALEAMMRGIPVISYSIGGLPNLIINGRNGWLVPAGDSSTFRKTIELWLTKSNEEKTLISSCAHHHIVNHFSDDAICPQVISLYERAVGIQVNAVSQNE